MYVEKNTKHVYIFSIIVDSLYCVQHNLLLCFRDELSKFMEKLGATPPGSMTLTTNLSKPFTRLDKYPSLLKELERHIEVMILLIVCSLYEY